VKALNGHAALQLAEAHHPSIALVDAKLPDIGGLDLAGQMRTLSPSICTIMISGYHYRDDPMIEAALCSGIIFDFIGKPFLHSEVVRVVETVLKTQQRGTSPD
jgi:YesN/AraC family two-component response regulator